MPPETVSAPASLSLYLTGNTFPRLSSFPAVSPRVVAWVVSLRGYTKPIVCDAAENGDVDKNEPEPASEDHRYPPLLTWTPVTTVNPTTTDSTPPISLSL